MSNRPITRLDTKMDFLSTTGTKCVSSHRTPTDEMPFASRSVTPNTRLLDLLTSLNMVRYRGSKTFSCTVSVSTFTFFNGMTGRVTSSPCV